MHDDQSVGFAWAELRDGFSRDFEPALLDLELVPGSRDREFTDENVRARKGNLWRVVGHNGLFVAKREKHANFAAGKQPFVKVSK